MNHRDHAAMTQASILARLEQGRSAKANQFRKTSSGVHMLVNFALGRPVGKSRINLSDALEVRGYIAPAVGDWFVKQPLMQQLEESAERVHGVLDETAQAIMSGQQGRTRAARLRLYDELGVFTGLLALAPQLREETAVKSLPDFGYVVSDSKKYDAALSLQGMTDAIIQAMQGRKRSPASQPKAAAAR